ncbi:MAG: xanthine phosphoribosyltransferase [Pseudomonadota bacterium]
MRETEPPGADRSDAAAAAAQEKAYHVSWEQLHRDSRALAWRLDGAGPLEGGAWRMVVAIARGGMTPACVIARELDIRLVDTLAIRSYQHQSQGALEVLTAPDPALVGAGAGVLVIDDLVDTGRTLEAARRLYPEAHFACLYAKPKGRPLVHSFVTEVSQDTWIYFPWDLQLAYAPPMRGRG